MEWPVRAFQTSMTTATVCFRTKCTHVMSQRIILSNPTTYLKSLTRSTKMKMVSGSYLPIYVSSLKDRAGRLLKPGKRGSSFGVMDIVALLLCLHSLGMPSPPYSTQQNLLQRPFLQGSSESHSMFCLNCSCQSSYIITSG